MPKINLLINLPGGFFNTPAIQPVFARMEKFATLRKTSHNNPEEIQADLAWADAVIMWSWPRLLDNLLDNAPKLKYAGQIDIAQEAAKVALRRGLPISVARGGFSPAVAEMALGLILTTLRKIGDYHAAMRTGQETWVTSFPDTIDPQERELTGRSVGLVGFGGVGQRLAELLAPFRTDLRIVDPYLPEGVEKKFNAKKVSLDEMLAASDVVVLCASANAGTKHLLGAKEIAALRPNAVLVNVARAALVDTEALIARLKKNDLFAAIDVFDKEPLQAEAELRSLPNAYLTPHRAGGLIASVDRILNWLVDDLEAHLAGQPRKWALTESLVSRLDS